MVSVLNYRPCRMAHKYRRWIREEWPHKAYTTWWNLGWRSRFLVYVDSNLANPNLNASLPESNVWLSLHACNVRDSIGLPILTGIGIRFGNRMHHDCEGLADSLFIISSMLSTCKLENEEKLNFSEGPDCVADFVCVCVCGVVAAIFLATSSSRPRADVTYCIHVLARRIAKTHTWTVSRSTLLVFVICCLSEKE